MPRGGKREGSGRKPKQSVPADAEQIVDRPHYLFKPGQSGNPAGRAKGSRNKLGEAFIADLYADWQQHGMRTVERVRNERPHEYLKVVASILPKELNVKTDDLADISDDRLATILDQLEHAIAAGVDGRAGSVASREESAPSAKPH